MTHSQVSPVGKAVLPLAPDREGRALQTARANLGHNLPCPTSLTTAGRTAREPDRGGLCACHDSRSVNHAVLEDMTVEVRNHLCIVGANDVGKSSLLRLLNLLLGATVQQLYAALSPAELRDPEAPLRVTVDLGDLSLEEAGSFPHEVHFEDDEPTRLTIELEVRVSEEDDNGVVIDRFFPDAGTRRAPSRDQLDVIAWRYLPANRSTAVDFIDGKKSPLRAMLNAVDLGDGSAARTGDAVLGIPESSDVAGHAR